MDIILPRTDAGVLVQLVVLGSLAAVSIWALRDRPNPRLLAIGVSVFVFSLMGLRALH